ncbi:hypothetical protein E6W17_23865 [Streptomyces sp. A1547]|nr:hypothetical protein E6W17_23865 [Streptomyces sp. A1547]
MLRNLLAYGITVAALLTMAGGNPHTHHTAPAVYDARADEIVGTWRCVGGTEVVFRADGSAAVTLLDGQERDYDHGWRLSGSGTWKLIGREPAGWNYGQHVRLHLPAPASAGARGDAPDRQPAPARYKWTFELRRDHRQTLELYFFLGEPGARSAYVLEKDA